MDLAACRSAATKPLHTSTPTEATCASCTTLVAVQATVEESDLSSNDTPHQQLQCCDICHKVQYCKMWKKPKLSGYGSSPCTTSHPGREGQFAVTNNFGEVSTYRRLEQLPLLLQGSRGRGIKKVAPNVPEIMKRKRYGQLAAEAREQIDVARQENKYKASREKAVCEEKKADEPVLASGKESKCDDDKADEQKGLMAERNPLEVEDTDTRSAREVASVDRYEDKTPEKQPGGEEEHEDAPAVALARQQKQHLGGGGGDGASDEEGNDGSLATEDTGVRSRGEQATVDKHKNEEMEKQPREKETGEDTPAVTTVEQEKDDLGDGRGVGGSEEEEEGNDETAQQEDIEGIEQEGSLKEDETDRLKPTGADVKAEEEGSDEAAHQEELKATELDGRLEKDETGRSKSTGGDVKSEVGEGSDAIGDWADASGITTPQFLTIGRETDSQHEVGVDSSSIFEEYPEYPESSVDAMQQEQIATATCDEDSGADSDGSGCTSEFYSSSWLERRV